jgi:hypothetical protein
LMVSSRITWDTPGHFAKILSSFISYKTYISIYFWMIKIVSRMPASTHQHINNGASNDNIVQFSTLF